MISVSAAFNATQDMYPLTQFWIIVSQVEWPKYTLDEPQNIVFDVNVTDLAYIEPDTFRADGLRFIIDNLDTVFGQ